jgi:hypothetical protein
MMLLGLGIACKWWNWHDSYVADAAPDKKWVEVSDAGEAAFRNQYASTRPGQALCRWDLTGGDGRSDETTLRSGQTEPCGYHRALPLARLHALREGDLFP